MMASVKFSHIDSVVELPFLWWTSSHLNNRSLLFTNAVLASTTWSKPTLLWNMIGIIQTWPTFVAYVVPTFKYC